MSKTHGPRDVGGLRKSLLGDYIMKYLVQDILVALYYVWFSVFFMWAMIDPMNARMFVALFVPTAAAGIAMKLADWI